MHFKGIYYGITVLQSLIITAFLTASINADQDLMRDAQSKFQDHIGQKTNIQTANLQIFISSSMSPSLIKQYAIEATKYNATLILRGLPNNSFKSLTKLVRTISLNHRESLSQIQIDDAAFAKFNITFVPSIVLSKNSDQSLPWKEDLIYDKVIGNIGIKKALELIVDDGDLSLEAQELLIAQNQ